MNLIESLNWRYATKKYSPQPLEDQKLQQILEATRLSPSSAGLQPYRVIVVESQSLRTKLGEGSFNAQIKEASHLLVFAAQTDIDQSYIDRYIQLVATERGTPAAALNDFKKSLEGYLLVRSPQENFSWATRQAYIALGTAVIAAAASEVDATPMEGFDPEQVDRLLGLREKGLKSVVLLALGYRDADNDPFASMKKVRIPREELFSELL